MAAFVTDTFTDTNGTVLTSHTGELGATWTKHGSLSTDVTPPEINTNGVRVGAATASLISIYYASGTPAGADYVVSGDINILTGSNGVAGIGGRIATGAGDGYFASMAPLSNQVGFYKYVGGTQTTVGMLTTSFQLDTYRTTFTLAGTTLSMRVQRLSDSLYIQTNGSWSASAVDCVSITDSAITAAGRAGILLYSPAVRDFVLSIDTDQAGGGGVALDDGSGYVQQRAERITNVSMWRQRWARAASGLLVPRPLLA